MASLFTSSGAAARKFRYEAEVGNIGINIGVAAPMALFPFSGWKESFFGGAARPGPGRGRVLHAGKSGSRALARGLGAVVLVRARTFLTATWTLGAVLLGACAAPTPIVQTVVVEREVTAPAATPAATVVAVTPTPIGGKLTLYSCLFDPGKLAVLFETFQAQYGVEVGCLAMSSGEAPGTHPGGARQSPGRCVVRNHHQPLAHNPGLRGS